MRARKSSVEITLVLLGAAALAACGAKDDATRRDLYANREDCLKDWGQDTSCQQAPAPAAQTGYHGLYWYGPWYRSGQFGLPPTQAERSAFGAPRPGSHAIATGHVSRGGFGASGAAHGASGGSHGASGGS